MLRRMPGRGVRGKIGHHSGDRTPGNGAVGNTQDSKHEKKQIVYIDQGETVR